MSPNIEFNAIISLRSDRFDIKCNTHEVKTIAREGLTLSFKTKRVRFYNYIYVTWRNNALIPLLTKGLKMSIDAVGFSSIYCFWEPFLITSSYARPLNITVHVYTVEGRGMRFRAASRLRVSRPEIRCFCHIWMIQLFRINGYWSLSLDCNMQQ